MRIVDERKSSALASTVLCPETEAGDLVFAGFVEFGEFLAELVFGDIGAVGVEDITLSHDISMAYGSEFVFATRVQEGNTHTTICFRPRREFRMNLRVRSVTGCSLSAMTADYDMPSIAKWQREQRGRATYEIQILVVSRLWFGNDCRQFCVGRVCAPN